MRTSALITALFSAAATTARLTGAGCPQPGPIIPPAIIDYDALQKALETRFQKFNSMAGLAELEINRTLTSFSVHVNGGGKVLNKIHHTATQRNESGVSVVDGKTYYRIASITKMFAYLGTLLQDGMNRDDRVGKWIKELDPKSTEGKKSKKEGWWDEVTLEMLGSHTAGLQREEYTLDFTSIPPGLLPDGFPTPADLGFPQVDAPKPIFQCKERDYKCKKADMIAKSARMMPVNQPGARPQYSNLGYSILTFALENASGKGFDDAIRKLIYKPLGMNDSTMYKPEDSRGAISLGPGALGWYMEDTVGLGVGSMFTTSDDMSKYLLNVHKLFKTPAAFKRWLSPRAYLGSNFEAVGEPFEIFRVNAYTPDNRPITLYTKGGNLPTYASNAVFIPEYGVSYSVFTASPVGEDKGAIEKYVVKCLIEEAEKISRQSARKALAGTYSGEVTYKDEKNNTAKSTIIFGISIDEKDPEAGLKVHTWKKDDKNLLPLMYQDLSLGAVTELPSNATYEGRLYSTNDQGNEWRLFMDMVQDREAMRKRITKGIYSDLGSNCIGWLLSGENYGEKEVALMKFNMGKNGMAESIEISAMRATLKRQADGAAATDKHVRREVVTRGVAEQL